ncbi:hypothetical protein [Haloprofundus halophilus]|uniref:hypothetical protein n=1 Tax=Haloprofundus halophilus TaxID=2283527 RepID=UPI001E59BAFC|nr:hypothetical protein [Haloprofundus halophilus]
MKRTTGTIEYVSTPDNRIPLAVIALGILVAVLPLLLLPKSSGPMAFVIRLLQVIAVIVGLGVVGAGFYSYRTGNLQLAVTTGLTVIGLVLVAALGGIVETRGNLFIPIWAWFVSAILVTAFAIATINRVVKGGQQRGF